MKLKVFYDIPWSHEKFQQGHQDVISIIHNSDSSKRQCTVCGGELLQTSLLTTNIIFFQSILVLFEQN